MTITKSMFREACRLAAITFIDPWRSHVDHLLGARLTVRGFDLDYPREAQR